MLPAVEFHEEAIAEAAEARRWYQVRSQRAADAFLAELDHAVEVIAATPERWPLVEEDIRRYLMRRFPYAVVYRAQKERAPLDMADGWGFHASLQQEATGGEQTREAFGLKPTSVWEARPHLSRWPRTIRNCAASKPACVGPEPTKI